MGKLIYIMGPSGAGKDSLLNAIRERADPRIVVAHRYITRAFNAGGENHVALSGGELAIRAKADFFLFHWNSHGYRYGIGREVLDWMAKDFCVLVNGSREYLPEAMNRYPGTVPLLVSVSPEILRERLIQRGRETMKEIEERLSRLRQTELEIPSKVKVLRNDGFLEETVDAFFRSVSLENVSVS